MEVFLKILFMAVFACFFVSDPSVAADAFKMNCAITKTDPNCKPPIDHFEIHGDLKGELILEVFERDKKTDRLTKQSVNNGIYSGYYKVKAYPKKIHRFTWGDDGDEELIASPADESNENLTAGTIITGVLGFNEDFGFEVKCSVLP